MREACETVGREPSELVYSAALVAAVGSAHRAEAFEACARLVERIKAEVPIWKRQGFEGGRTEWVGL